MELIAPLRFGVVQPNLYRGTYPREHNIRFLKRLGLKTILSLTPEPLAGPVAQWAQESGVTLVHVECVGASQKSKKKRGVPVDYESIRSAVLYMIDNDHAPMYVHCLNGSQVTALAIGCLRKLSFLSFSAIADEFLRYAELELADQEFIEGFRTEIDVPDRPVPWMWKGLSKSGVVQHHPTLRIHDRSEDLIKRS